VTDIAFGSANEFNAAGTLFVSVAILDATHFVGIYCHNGDSDHGYAVVGVFSGTTITSYGTPLEFNNAVTYEMFVAALDSTHFVIVYQDGGDSNYGKAKVGLVSGSTISSYGASNTFLSSTATRLSVAALDATHFALTYRDMTDSNHGKARVGLVSGTTISSYGAANKFLAETLTYPAIAKLDATHFVVACSGTSDHGNAIVGLVSGTTISSYGSLNEFTTDTTIKISVAALDATHFVVAYRDNTDSDKGKAVVGLVSGTTISSYGAISTFTASNITTTSLAALTSTQFAVAYNDAGDSNHGKAIIGDVSAVTISSYGAIAEFNPATTTYLSIAALTATIAVIYDDGADSEHGKAIIGFISTPFGGKVLGVSSPAKVDGVTSPAKVMGV